MMKIQKKYHFKKACAIWAMLAVFSFFQFFVQTAGNMMASLWKVDFHLNDVSLSFLSSSFFYAYVLVQVLAGFLYDHWGTKKVVRLSVFLFSLGLLLFAISHSFYFAVLARILMGFAAGFAFVGLVYVSAHWFKPSLFIVFVGLGEMLSMSLTATGQWLASNWILQFGWRPIILLLSILSAILFMVVLLFLKNPANFKPSHKPFLKSFTEGFCQVVKIPAVWLAGIFTGGLFSVITVFTSLWGSYFLENAYHFSYLDATRLTALIPFGFAFGGPFFGFVNARFIPTRTLIRLISFILLMLSLAILFLGSSVFVVTCLLVLLGFFGGSVVLGFYIIEQKVHDQIRGIAVGTGNAIAILGGTLFQSLIGLLFQLHLSPSLAMLPFSGIIFMAFLATIFLKQITQKQ